jgi:ERCC4-type nuclease
MRIKIDTRETDLLAKISNLIATVPLYKNIEIISETLLLGDVIIEDIKNVIDGSSSNEEILIIERKSINDLVASIKDGRYEEQSYRLNGLPHHNHNIIYMIEGNVSFAKDDATKLTVYSAMFSLNYYKGFSVLRSFHLDESATIICNIAHKLEREKLAGKKTPYYSNNIMGVVKASASASHSNPDTLIGTENKNPSATYIDMVKRAKKDNITPDNIHEIMLCQIPGISTVSATAIIQKYPTIIDLAKAIELDNNCLLDISYMNEKGKTRKINKTCTTNIITYLMKK